MVILGYPELVAVGSHRGFGQGTALPGFNILAARVHGQDCDEGEADSHRGDT